MLCVNHWILLYIPAVLPGRSLQWVLKSTQTAEVQTDYQLTYFIITMSSHSWVPHSLLCSFKKQPKGRTDTHHPTCHSYSSFIPPPTCNQPLLTDLQPKGFSHCWQSLAHEDTSQDNLGMWRQRPRVPQMKAGASEPHTSACSAVG